MQLFVRTDTGRTVVLAVDYNATIREVLALVHEKELQASGNDNQQRKGLFNELVSKNAAYGKHNPEVDKSDCEGDDAASNGAFRMKPRAASRYLHYGGVPLRPQRALYEYGIQNHATLELSARLRGGCFGFSIMLWIVIFICCVLSICTCGLSLGVAAILLPFALLLPLCCL